MSVKDIDLREVIAPEVITNAPEPVLNPVAEAEAPAEPVLEVTEAVSPEPDLDPEEDLEDLYLHPTYVPELETTWQQRLYIEWYELDVKLQDLVSFFGTSQFMELSPDTRTDLTRQSQAMSDYLGILSYRLNQLQRAV